MEILFIGAVGGIANEVLHWYGLRTNKSFPHYAKKPFYWLITLAMICIGSFFAYIQLGPGAEDRFLAFELGLLAPLILKKVVSSGKPNDGAMSRDTASWRNFLKG